MYGAGQFCVVTIAYALEADRPEFKIWLCCLLFIKLMTLSKSLICRSLRGCCEKVFKGHTLALKKGSIC